MQADDNFHNELVKAFGRDAGNRRYDLDQRSWPQPVRIACRYFQIATKRWIEAMKAEPVPNSDAIDQASAWANQT